MASAAIRAAAAEFREQLPALETHERMANGFRPSWNICFMPNCHGISTYLNFKSAEGERTLYVRHDGILVAITYGLVNGLPAFDGRWIDY